MCGTARAQQRTKEAWAGYVRCALAAVPTSAPVESVVATTGAERTADGLGVGTTLAEAKRLLPASAVCGVARGTTVCVVRRAGLQTRVVVSRGRVTRSSCAARKRVAGIEPA